MEKNTTIGTRHLRTKIAIGYALILLLVGGGNGVGKEPKIRLQGV